MQSAWPGDESMWGASPSPRRRKPPGLSLGGRASCLSRSRATRPTPYPKTGRGSDSAIHRSPPTRASLPVVDDRARLALAELVRAVASADPFELARCIDAYDAATPELSVNETESDSFLVIAAGEAFSLVGRMQRNANGAVPALTNVPEPTDVTTLATAVERDPAPGDLSPGLASGGTVVVVSKGPQKANPWSDVSTLFLQRLPLRLSVVTLGQNKTRDQKETERQHCQTRKGRGKFLSHIRFASGSHATMLYEVSPDSPAVLHARAPAASRLGALGSRNGGAAA